MDIKVPTNSDVLIAKKEIPNEVVEAAKKSKRRSNNNATDLLLW